MISSSATEMVSSWYLSLAQMKARCFPGLESFKIIEVIYLDTAKQLQWDYPEDVRNVFEAAGIAFSVYLRDKDMHFWHLARHQEETMDGCPNFIRSRPRTL